MRELPVSTAMVVKTDREAIPDDQVLMTPLEVGHVLGVSRGSLWAMRKAGIGPAHLVIGSSVMYRTNDIEQYLDEHPEGVELPTRRQLQEGDA